MAAKPDDDLLYRFRAAHKKRDGWCRITARGIEWQSDREDKAIDVPYAELASHEVSPEDHPKALLRLSRAEGKALVLTILEATPDRAYATLCDAKLAITACIRRRRRRGEHQPVEPSKERPTAKRAEVMRRAKLLQSDEALQKRHKELVVTGAVDEEAFWAAATGRRAPAAEKAVRAPSNELLVDAPREGESTGRTVTFSLSPEKIAFVFSMYPAVRRAHAAHVPKVCVGVRIVASSDGVEAAGLAVGISHQRRAGGTRAPPSHRRDTHTCRRRAEASGAHTTSRATEQTLPRVASMAHELYTPTPPARRRRDGADTIHPTQDMSEAQFWVKYFQSRYFWRDKGRAVLEKGSQKADVADDLFARHEQEGDDALQVAPEVRQAVDLSRTDADRFITAQEDVVDPAAPAASRVLRKFNRHAALVLGADPPSIPSEEPVKKSDHVTLDLKHHDSKKSSKKRSVAAAFAMDDEDLDRPNGVQWSNIDVEQALTNKAGIDALISLDRNVASVQPGPPKQTSQQIEKVAGDVRLLVRALRFTQGTAKRQAILKKLRQLQAFIDQRCAAFNAKPKHAHLAAFFKPVQDQIARALRK